MKLPSRKSRTQRFLEHAGESLDLVSAVKSVLPGGGSSKAAKARLPGAEALSSHLHLPKAAKELTVSSPQGKALAAGVVATGVAGLTAASAGISSLRRRTEGARVNS